ncbi:MAG: phage antirepressor KilAC domain-containing protein [Clostridia bacterium]|nr:phage antirepressor KilAC domain-containing protein [Clostridia bacterium]
MNQLQRIFNYQGNRVRTTIKDGQPWFIARDVCNILELDNVGQALTRLDDDEKGTIILNDGTPGNPNMAIVNEPGLYSLILASRKPEARVFKRWVTHEVLPSIRQTGMYAIVPKTLPEALRAYADEVERRELAEAEVAKLKPKAEFFDAVADSKDAIPIGDAAKVLNCGIGRNRLFAFLREKGVLMTNNVPYQDYIDRGYFRVIEQKWTTPNGETRISIKTLVYQKGLNYIRNLLNPKHDKLAIVG